MLEVLFGSPLPPIAVEGDSVGLRCFTDADLPCIEAGAQDPHVVAITTVPAADVYSRDEGLAYIARQNGRLRDGEGWSLAIVDRTAGRDKANAGQAIGQVGLWISQLHKGRAEIGYWVAPAARGRGAAAEAVGLLGQWAFANLDLDRLNLYIEPWNTASIRTAERAGYEREALLANWERIGGVSKDMLVYRRLRPD